MAAPANDCGRHRPYRTRAEATWRASWHLTCPKCKRGWPFRAWFCDEGRHWHVGHGRVWLQAQAAR